MQDVATKELLVTQSNNINQRQACSSSELLSSALFANRSERCILTIKCSCARHSVFAPPAIRRRVESTELELPGSKRTQTAPLQDCVALWHKQQPDPGWGVRCGWSCSQKLLQVNCCTRLFNQHRCQIFIAGISMHQNFEPDEGFGAQLREP